MPRSRKDVTRSTASLSIINRAVLQITLACLPCASFSKLTHMLVSYFNTGDYSAEWLDDSAEFLSSAVKPRSVTECQIISQMCWSCCSSPYCWGFRNCVFNDFFVCWVRYSKAWCFIMTYFMLSVCDPKQSLITKGNMLDAFIQQQSAHSTAIYAWTSKFELLPPSETS